MDYKEIFDRYLDGKLSGEELINFERSVKEDPALARELDRYKKLNAVSEKIFADDSVDQQAQDDIREYKQLDTEKDIDMQHFRKSLDMADRRRFSPVWYAAAVMLAGMITVSIVLLVNKPGGMAEMYASYYEEYHPSDKIFEITRSNDDLYFAVQVYEAGDLSRAGLLFNELSDSTEFAPFSHFYLGLMYIQQEKWEAAIGSFNQVITCGESDILIDARWYLGLCYLRIENASAARRQFDILSESENEYSKRARKILKHLD